LNGTAFYADHSFTPRRNSFSRRRRSSFGAPKQSSVRINAARRSQLFRTGGQLLSPIIEDRQMSPISRVPRDLSVYPDSLDNTLIPQRLVPLIDNSQQFIDQYRTYDDLDGSFEQDSLNPVLLASRTETSPINNLSNDPDRTMRLSPNRSLRLSPNPNVNSRRRTIKLRKQDPNFVTRDERPDAIDLGLEVPSLDTDPSVINEVATMMRQAHLRDDFDPDNFVNLGFSEGLLSAALQLSYDILSESDKRQIREVQLKKKKRLIEREADKLSKEMGVELINKKKVDMNKYRGIPSDVLAKAYKKALNVKKRLFEMWEKEENAQKKANDLKRKPFNLRKGFRSPGSTRRVAPAWIENKEKKYMKHLSTNSIVPTLLYQYEEGTFNPDLPLNEQIFSFPNNYVVDPESYAEALKIFKRIHELDVVDSTPAQTDLDLKYFNSQIDDRTRTEVFGINQRRLYHGGKQFSNDEIKNLQKKITDMYEDEDYEDPIVEEEDPIVEEEDPIVEEQPRELLKFDPNDQFETEYYGTDSDDDL